MDNSSEDPRALLTALHQAAVQGANPFTRTNIAVREWITSSSLTPSTRIHVFALGKAAATMTAGTFQALREHGLTVAGGVVVAAATPAVNATPVQGGDLPAVLEFRVGDHPVPDLGSLAAADVIARKVQEVQAGDVVLVLISGGATSLCAAPCDELREMIGHTADAHELLTRLVATLHECGLAIHEMNAIRRRLLRWGGGRLATALAARNVQEIRVLSVSDVIGDQPSVIGSGPCSPDPMSEAEFLAMLDAYKLRDRIPRELAVALGLQGSAEDAVLPPHPGDAAFDLVDYTIVARNLDACRAMAERARDFGIEDITMVELPLSGEAETLGHTIASIAVRSAANDTREQLIIWGGEPTVSMNVDALRSSSNVASSESEVDDDTDAFDPEETGFVPVRDLRTEPEIVLPPMGGRMQALALSAALALEGEMARHGREADAFRAFILAAGTDGRDGPTDACGAIIDALTPLAARELGRDPASDLQWLRSYHSLDAARALLKTGPTGTNVMDVVALYIAPAAANE